MIISIKSNGICQTTRNNGGSTMKRAILSLIAAGTLVLASPVWAGQAIDPGALMPAAVHTITPDKAQGVYMAADDIKYTQVATADDITYADDAVLAHDDQTDTRTGGQPDTISGILASNDNMAGKYSGGKQKVAFDSGPWPSATPPYHLLNLSDSKISGGPLGLATARSQSSCYNCHSSNPTQPPI